MKKLKLLLLVVLTSLAIGNTETIASPAYNMEIAWDYVTDPYFPGWRAIVDVGTSPGIYFGAKIFEQNQTRVGVNIEFSGYYYFKVTYSQWSDVVDTTDNIYRVTFIPDHPITYWTPDIF